jgi:hypothetical protein
MPNPSHSSRFYHPYNSGWEVHWTSSRSKIMGYINKLHKNYKFFRHQVCMIG